MIWWTIPAASALSTTGVTEIVGSSSSSSSFQAEQAWDDGLFEQTDRGSATASASSTHIGRTSVDGLGATTFFSQIEEASYTFLGNVTFDLTPEAQSNTANYYEGPTFGEETDSSSSSTSFSGETITVFTASVQTSTTGTAISGYETTFTEPGTTTAYTTSQEGSGTDTSVVFVTTEASFERVTYDIATRESTYAFVTDLEETVASPFLRATVVQADPSDVVFVITSPPTNIVDYSAATALAQSATRMTLEPVIATTQRAEANSTRATSTISSAQTTLNLSYVGTKTVSTIETTADYNSFPPTTATRSTRATRTTNVTAGSVTLCSREAITHGGTRNSITASSFQTYSTTVARRIADMTFATTKIATSTFTINTTIAAAPTASGLTTATTTFPHGYNFAPATAQSGFTTFSSSAARGNTILPTARPQLGPLSPGFVGQTKYGTVGAAIGSQKGGWITANETSSEAVLFNRVYALDGQRRATTMFPVTNESETVNATGISWTTSTTTAGTGTETSAPTTITASFGVLGLTQTTTFDRSIGMVGGYAAPQETFIRTAADGVYRNRVDGSTHFFDGSASVVTEGQSATPSFFENISDLRDLQLSTDANPIFWSEPRNSAALPPAMPPDA